MFFQTLYEWLGTYFIPADLEIIINESTFNLLSIVTSAITVGALWVCIFRPFYLIFKYYLFGGSKKHRKLNNYDKED